MQIYENIRKYTIFIQYTKIHTRLNLLKYTYIYDIRKFYLDYSPSGNESKPSEQQFTPT